MRSVFPMFFFIILFLLMKESVDGPNNSGHQTKTDQTNQHQFERFVFHKPKVRQMGKHFW
jgi:hypothetical protein